MIHWNIVSKYAVWAIRWAVTNLLIMLRFYKFQIDGQHCNPISMGKLVAMYSPDSNIFVEQEYRSSEGETKVCEAKPEHW